MSKLLAHVSKKAIDKSDSAKTPKKDTVIKK